MAIQAKNVLLYLLVAVFVFFAVLPQVSGARRKPATRNRPRRQDCRDDMKVQPTCAKLVKELGFKVCHTGIEQLKAKMTRSCAATCHSCDKRQRSCRRSKYRCCWDGFTPAGDIFGVKDCPVCKDHLALCNRFRNFCSLKKTSANREFIELHCPLTCGKCKERKNLKHRGQKIRMNDWFRI